MFYTLVMLVPRVEEDARGLPQSPAFWLGCVIPSCGGWGGVGWGAAESSLSFSGFLLIALNQAVSIPLASQTIA